MCIVVLFKFVTAEETLLTCHDLTQFIYCFIFFDFTYSWDRKMTGMFMTLHEILEIRVFLQ